MSFKPTFQFKCICKSGYYIEDLKNNQKLPLKIMDWTHSFHQPEKFLEVGTYSICGTGSFYAYYDGKYLHDHHYKYLIRDNDFIRVGPPEYIVHYEEGHLWV